jgi:hypothetical protein
MTCSKVLPEGHPRGDEPKIRDMMPVCTDFPAIDSGLDRGASPRRPRPAVYFLNAPKPPQPGDRDSRMDAGLPASHSPRRGRTDWSNRRVEVDEAHEGRSVQKRRMEQWLM